MEALYSYLKEHPVTYVTRQTERALGLLQDTPGYHIYADPAKSTRELLATESFAQKQAEHKTDILVFKSNRQEEELCAVKGWKMLNPDALLAERVESKIGQVRWLEDLARYLPSAAIRTCRELRWDGIPTIVQFNHSHSGLGTMLVDSERKALDLAQKFPARPVRVTRFVRGPVYTSNNIIGEGRVILGNLSYQITGLLPLTDNLFATVGNDWGLGVALEKGIAEEIKEMAIEIGRKLMTSGWKGCFGLDVVVEEETKTPYLIEINARQTASVTFESILQKEREPSGLSTFEAHLSALAGIAITGELTSVNKGARFVHRKSQRILPKSVSDELRIAGFEILEFPAEKEGDDLLHIRSRENLMRAHGIPSELGAGALEKLIDHD